MSDSLPTDETLGEELETGGEVVIDVREAGVFGTALTAIRKTRQMQSDSASITIDFFMKLRILLLLFVTLTHHFALIRRTRRMMKHCVSSFTIENDERK